MKIVFLPPRYFAEAAARVQQFRPQCMLTNMPAFYVNESDMLVMLGDAGSEVMKFPESWIAERLGDLPISIHAMVEWVNDKDIEWEKF